MRLSNLYLKNINNNEIIKLANVHLCGGRFDENIKIGGMLSGNIKDVKLRKNEMLYTLVNKYDIDIIAGDFNSDLICYLNNELQEQHISYFKKISPNTPIKNFKEWNVTPYNYLKSNDYKLAINKDNILKTSIFNTHPDSIWFKKGKLEKFKYINLIKDNLSDHNGIYCKIIL